MRGNTRKIATDRKRETREQRSVSFTKRRQGLYSKAAELCLFGGARVAIVVSSPCSGRNLYSFGHSSVDAVFDDFLEGRLPDDAGDGGVAKSALPLYQEIKSLVWKTNEGIKKSESDEFWREIEVLEKNCNSVEELQDLVDHLEKIKEKASTMMITSNLPSSSNLFNPADNFACLYENCSSDVADFGAITEYIPPTQDVNYNNVDENYTLWGSDFINFDENYVGDEYNNVDEQVDFGMATDSTQHILDSFTMDYEAGSVLAGCM